MASVVPRRALGWRALFEILVESARTSSMLFMILIGALVFANFVNSTSTPEDLETFVEQFQIHPITVIVAICVLYAVLGTAMEDLSHEIINVQKGEMTC